MNKEEITKVKLGDVVRLVSGGLPMTVVEIFFPPKVHCRWFDKDESHRGSFPPEALVKLSKDAASGLWVENT